MARVAPPIPPRSGNGLGAHTLLGRGMRHAAGIPIAGDAEPAPRRHEHVADLLQSAGLLERRQIARVAADDAVE